jgi:hypothetical protein
MGAATAIWVLWIAVSSFVVGGYLVGRMRRRVHESSEHESDIRDGVHGLVVWAIGALLIGWMATSSITGLAKGVTGETLGSAGQKLLQSNEPFAYLADRLWRSTTPNVALSDVGKLEAASILANSASNGAMSPDDKAYLSALIAVRTGLAPSDAAKRVDETMKQITVNADKAKQAAEKARKLGILVAFLTATSLAISAAAAWWAASKGGKHRDEGVDLAHLTAWR